MTLDEAIRHCLEQARKLQDKADRVGDDESRQCMECSADHIQLAEWLNELKEAKRLLKAAIDDIYKARQGCNCNICDMPPEPTERCQYENGEDCQFKWRYADEALKLIGGAEND